MSEDHCRDSCSWMYGVGRPISHEEVDGGLRWALRSTFPRRFNVYFDERLRDLEEGVRAVRGAAYLGAMAVASLFR